jgi:hypothetical protein
MTAIARAIGFVLIAALPAARALAQELPSYKGKLLVEVLQDLQNRGLPIVFSSAIVRPDLRVNTEPRAKSARQRLEELLAPYGLAVREGPGGTLQIVNAAPAKREHAERGGSLRGQAVDAWTSTPLARVHVRVEGSSGDAQTDGAGQFVISQLAKGTRIVTASAAGYRSVRRAIAIDAGGIATVVLRLYPDARRYEEFISVSDSVPARTDRGVVSESSLDRDDFAHLHGSISADPLRAVEVFPGVTSVDDFHSDVAVRGSPFRHVDLVVDGVSTHWLRHTAFGRGATGSLTMLSGLVVERTTLRSGAYPRRHGDRLGSELDLLLREGSRRAFAIRGAIGGGHGVLVAEGPLGAGENGSARGSWLASARQSYLEWPPERHATSRAPFGFSDVLAKIAFDVRPTQRFTLTAIRGVSDVDEEEDALLPNEPAEGINTATVLSLSWHSTIAPAFILRQQVSIVSHRAWNPGHHVQAGARDSSHAAYSYRADFSRPVAGGMLEAGGLVEHLKTVENGMVASNDGSSWLRSGFAHFSWSATPSLTLSPGLRVTTSTVVPTPVIARWLLGEWAFRNGWSAIASAGTSRQMPDLLYTLGATGSRSLLPERASHVDVGIEHELTSTIRWQATMFNRREADVIQSPYLHPRLVANALALPTAGERYTNDLRGTSRGIELLLSRRSPRGLDGWASYAYGRTRHNDDARGETFWADFDRRHAFGVFAQYRVSPVTSIGTTFRAGSNFPIPGYFTMIGDQLFVGSDRNQVRLPSYARLDLRADRRFRYGAGSFTVFVEGLNVLNRTNTGVANGFIHPTTGAAIGFTDTLLRRRLSAGLVFEF